MNKSIRYGMIALIVTFIIILTIFFERDVGFYGFVLIAVRYILTVLLITAFLIELSKIRRRKSNKQYVKFVILLGFSVATVLMMIIFFNKEIMFSREIIYFHSNSTEFNGYISDNIDIIPSRRYLSYVYAANQDTIPTYIQRGIYSLSCHYKLAGNWFICSIGT